jgi:1-acyl-sn-glycerol-3-phosphate acyltransferase
MDPGMNPIYRFNGAVSRLVLRVFFRYEARGIENLPEGGFVLAAGHHSNFDPWPLGTAISNRHFVRFMAKSELFWWPLSFFMRGMGAFKVRRDENDREALSTAWRLLREGNVIAMFPEGTKRTKGLLRRRKVKAHPGAARIALGAGVPLVPAGLTGTDRLSRLPKLKVSYGAPVPVDDLAGLGRREAARVATERLMERIYELEASLAR